MAKLFKILGIVIGVVLLLVVAASVILPLVVDPNDFKGEIVNQVKQQTGRELKIDGDLNLSLFPWLGVQMDGVELSNAKGFGKQPFVSVKHAAVRVKLKPLLDRRLEVDTISLDGVTINLARNKSGTSNWDDLAQATKGKTKADKEKKQDKTGLDTSIAGFSIGGVDIKDARISWDDSQSGQKYEISQFNLSSGAIVPGSPVVLNMDMVLDSKEPAVQAKVALGGTVLLDEAKGVLKIGDLKLTLDADGAALPNGRFKADITTALTLSLDGKLLSLQNLKVKSGDLDLKGEIKGTNLGTASQVFNGNLKLAEFNLREWMASQGMALPATSDPKALGRLAASVNLVSKGTSTNLNKLAIQLDDTRISGNATLRGGATAFKLKLDSINLDRYMPTGSGTGGSGKSQNGGSRKASGAEQLFPVASLRKLDLNGSVDVGRLTINKLLVEKVLFTVKAKNGLLQTTQKVGGFYQGSYNGSVNINVKGKSPRVDISSTLSKVNLGPLIKTLAGEDRLSGQGFFKANLRAGGNSVDSLKSSLNGKLNFKFLKGAVKGINLANELRKAKGFLSGKPVAESSGPVQTDFSKITASGVVKKGVIHNSDLKALSPFLRVNGKGTVNLVSEKVNYTAEVFIVETSKGQGGHELASLEELKRKKIGVPVRFTGPLAAPKWEVQWKKVLLDMKKDELKSAAKKLLKLEGESEGDSGSIKDKLKEKLLKKLF